MLSVTINHGVMRQEVLFRDSSKSCGITSDMWSLRFEHFKMIYSCLPLPAEPAAKGAGGEIIEPTVAG